ncbi:hypothetical protein [Salibacterium lacus]|uniref:Uncharacterized protein n=1 Tax=Salibacterium lacus TaxID=1898109 RepID=A0ABW5T1N8_9BACI
MNDSAFSTYMSSHVQEVVNKDLADIVARIVAAEMFENEWETFEFFPHLGAQYVIRSQENPSRCKGYQLPFFAEALTETLHVKKEESSIYLFTSKECALQQ